MKIRLGLLSAAATLTLTAARGAGAQAPADSLLAVGDTGAAIAVLRDAASSPAELCRLATLITSQVTSRHADWRGRLEAEQLFERSLKERLDPGCFLGYSALKEKQGIRVDAGRLARRAYGLLRDRPDLATPALLAETYYRRALPIAEWVRNFERPVQPQNLPVSTRSCLDAGGQFCESLDQAIPGGHRRDRHGKRPGGAQRTSHLACRTGRGPVEPAMSARPPCSAPSARGVVVPQYCSRPDHWHRCAAGRRVAQSQVSHSNPVSIPVSIRD